MDDSVRDVETGDTCGALAIKPARPKRRRKTVQEDLTVQTALLQQRYSLMDFEIFGTAPHDRWMNAVALAKLQELAGDLAIRSCRHEKRGHRCWSCHPLVLSVWRPGYRVNATFQWAGGVQ